MGKVGTIDVWVEGYQVQGNASTARLLSSVIATNLEIAVEKLKAHGNCHGIEGKVGKPNIWGCRLFDNELDARKSFG
jgi:hypothetical protein